MNTKRNLIIIICIILFAILYFFNFLIIKNNRNDINGVYICNNYETIYSTSKLADNYCSKIKFTCKNCEISDFYIEDKIIYKEGKNKIVVYDLKKNKVIDKFKTSLTTYDYYNSKTYKDISIDYFKQDNNNYGFSFIGKDNNKYFYNINSSKLIKLEGDICYTSNRESLNILDDSIECTMSDTVKTYAIKNDRVIIKNKENKYGIMNLSNGNYDIKPSQNYIILDNFYYLTEKEEYVSKDYYILENNILDNELKPYFANNLKIYPTKVLNENIFVAYDKNYYDEYDLIFIDKNVNEYFRLCYSKIASDVYKMLGNSGLKKYINEYTILETLNKDNSINFSLDNNIITVSVNYYAEYEEEYDGIEIIYKYDIDKNSLSIHKYDYEENGCEC